MHTTFMETPTLLKVSEMAENLIGSEIIKLSNEVKEKIKQGENIYNFTIGDFDPNVFPIPQDLKNEIIKAYQNNETNYPAANGMAELRKSVSRFLHTRGGLEFNENQILVSGGARPLIYAIYQTVLDPGDTVVFPVPSWNNNHYAHLSRTNAVFVETSAANNFMPTAADLKPYISQANLIALCSPLNPTGTVFSRTQLEEICLMVMEENRKRGESRKSVYIMYDQIYWMLTHGDTVHYDPVSLFPEMKNYTIYVDGISKSFAATGVRVGWSFGPQKVIDKMKSILSHVGAWSPKAEQMATARFLNMDAKVDSFMSDFNAAISQRLTAFYNGFMQLKEEGYKVDAIEPQAAIYLTVQLNLHGQKTEDGRKLSSTQDVTKYVLDEAKVALVPFYAFGASTNSSWYRLSVGTATVSDIDNFFVNLRAALKKLIPV
jgi:aspartate aminotransferase